MGMVEMRATADHADGTDPRRGCHLCLSTLHPSNFKIGYHLDGSVLSAGSVVVKTTGSQA